MNLQLGKAWEAIKVAIEAERTTPTGKLNLASLILIALITIVILAASPFEIIGDVILALAGKHPITIIPSWFLPAAAGYFGSVLIICLFAVWKMEQKK